MKPALLILALLCAACSPDEVIDPYSLGRTVNIAHRGGAWLAPENTLEAFRNAEKIGADVLELDLRLTADGAAAVMHDESVDRTCDGTGLVRDFTLAELKDLDAAYYFKEDEGFPLRGKGVRVPGWEDVLEEFPSAYIEAEIKDDEYDLVVEALDLIAEHDATDRVAIASAHTEALNHVRQLAPDIRVAMSIEESLSFFLEGTEPKGSFVQTPKETVDAGMVKYAQDRGVGIHVYIVNSPVEMEQLIEMEAEGLITDDPQRLKDLL